MAQVTLTTEQRNTIMSAVGMGFQLDEFLQRHVGWPENEVIRFWNALAAEMNTTTLPPGHYWGVPSEWS